MKSAVTFGLLAALSSSLGTVAAIAETRHAGAHVHGINQLQILQQGTGILATYIMPVGQLSSAEMHDDDHHHEDEDHTESSHHGEHEKEESVELGEKLDEFANPSLLFKLVGVEDACQIKGYNYEVKAVVADPDAPHAGHRDAILQYEFSCEAGAEFSVLEILAFERFSELEAVDIEGLIDGRGVSQRVSKNASQVDL